MESDYLPSFCTACYGSHRTGERFMSICKNEQIHNFCHPNAIMTLKEYLVDYASSKTKETGEKLITKELEKITDNERKRVVIENLDKITHGERDFKF